MPGADARELRAVLPRGDVPAKTRRLGRFQADAQGAAFSNGDFNADRVLNVLEGGLQFAYLYAKTVTLGRTHWPATNRVMLRNRRIGCSLSGVAQFVAARGTWDKILLGACVVDLRLRYMVDSRAPRVAALVRRGLRAHPGL